MMLDAPEGGSSQTRWRVFWDWKYGRRVSRWEAAATSASPGDLLLVLILVSSATSFSVTLFLDLNLRNNPPPLPLFLDAAAALSSP